MDGRSQNLKRLIHSLNRFYQKPPLQSGGFCLSQNDCILCKFGKFDNLSKFVLRLILEIMKTQQKSKGTLKIFILVFCFIFSIKSSFAVEKVQIIITNSCSYICNLLDAGGNLVRSINVGSSSTVVDCFITSSTVTQVQFVEPGSPVNCILFTLNTSTTGYQCTAPPFCPCNCTTSSNSFTIGAWTALGSGTLCTSTAPFSLVITIT
jgi:hypothetical protein